MEMGTWLGEKKADRALVQYTSTTEGACQRHERTEKEKRTVCEEKTLPEEGYKRKQQVKEMVGIKKKKWKQRYKKKKKKKKKYTPTKSSPNQGEKEEK